MCGTFFRFFATFVEFWRFFKVGDFLGIEHGGRGNRHDSLLSHAINAEVNEQLELKMTFGHEHDIREHTPVVYKVFATSMEE